MSARVLVVDDDPVVMGAVATALARGGFAVTTAADGVEAMQLDTPFDAIVVDFHMTRAASGADVVRHFKARRGAGVYCAVLSGEDSAAMLEACTRAGADEILIKPVSTIALRQRLTAAARARRGEAA